MAFLLAWHHFPVGQCAILTCGACRAHEEKRSTFVPVSPTAYKLLAPGSPVPALLANSLKLHLPGGARHSACRAELAAQRYLGSVEEVVLQLPHKPAILLEMASRIAALSVCGSCASTIRARTLMHTDCKGVSLQAANMHMLAVCRSMGGRAGRAKALSSSGA